MNTARSSFSSQRFVRHSKRRIGLFLGSFNPVHEGHKYIAEQALKRLDLHEIWWVVSPQNPLKTMGMSYEKRTQAITELGLPRAHKMVHLERDFGTQYTIDTLKSLQKHKHFARFVMIIGADNLTNLPLWKNWYQIMHLIPICVMARSIVPSSAARGFTPTPALRARLSQPARMFSHVRLLPSQSRLLPLKLPPQWVYIPIRYNSLQSRLLRS